MVNYNYTMPPTLYPKERQLLDFITQFIQRYGYAPTLKEMGAAVGMNSVATVHEHIDRLRQPPVQLFISVQYVMQAPCLTVIGRFSCIFL